MDPLDRESLLDEHYDAGFPPLRGRELAIEAGFAAVFLCAAVGLALATDVATGSLATAAGLTLAYAIASRVEFHAGSAFGIPTQVVFVPMVLLIPPPLVPFLAAAGLLLGRVPEVIARRAPADRLLTAVSDGFYALGPAAVLALDDPATDPARAYGVAFVAQGAMELGGSLLKEWLRRGVPPRRMLRPVLEVLVLDALLTPIGVLAALASAVWTEAWVLVLSLTLLLGLMARERGERIGEAHARLAALRRERSRLDAAVARIGEAFAVNLDRDGLLRLVVRTAVDAVDAAGGRARLLDGSGAVAHGEAPSLLAAAEHAALEAGSVACVETDEWAALACPVPGHAPGRPVAVLSVARQTAPFGAPLADSLARLAAHAAVSLENLALHERLRRQALVDELTGLANHRRFQECMGEEVRRARAEGRRLGLLLVDVDDFKRVNDSHGHLVGDRILIEIARRLSSCAREGAVAARYGGEELALIVPGADPGALRAVGERVRAAVADTPVRIDEELSLSVTVSVGVAAGRGASHDARRLIADADAALYRAKREGKDRVVLAGPQEPAPVVALLS